MKTSGIIKIALALILCCSTAVMADEGKDESGKGRQPKAEHRQNNDQGSYFRNAMMTSAPTLVKMNADDLSSPNGEY